MYRSKKNSSGGRNGNSRNGGSRSGSRGGGGKRYFGGGNRGRGGRGGRGRKQSSFNPTLLIKNANAAAAVETTETVKPAYVAKNTFSDFNICEPLKQNILARGYKTPTPIQDQIINHIIEGRDVTGLASTGTGKTAAFLIPLISNIFNSINDENQKLGRVLIMAPTRELAVQIEEEFKIFARGLGIDSTLCIGGANMNRQISSLRRQPHFIIGTPGRLIDLEKRRKFNLSSFSAIVLDEVDQMLDMGFINDMKYVIDNLPEDRHSLFFSATMPGKLDNIVNSFLTNPIRVQVEKQQASANVAQDIVKIKGRAKVDVLHDLLDTEGFDKVLVFGRTKHGLNKLSKILFDRGVKVSAIHGNKSQSQRQRALQQFKRNRIQVLLATDIASRGLDIDDVTHVINYDLPQTYEDYIHRIGRTGRANKTGVALSFVD